MQAIIRSHDHVAALYAKALARRATLPPANALAEPAPIFEIEISSDHREWLDSIAKMRMISTSEVLSLIIAHHVQS